MPRGRWTPSDEQMAIEAYSVLLKRKKASRRYPKSFLLATLARSEVRTDFLKLALEHDDTVDLKEFRKALGLVAAATGWSKLSARSQISRMSLYRMFGPGGNPRLNTLVAVLRALNLHFWVVDRGFIRSRKRIVRPKDVLASSEEASRWIRESSYGEGHPHWDPAAV